MYKSLYCNSNFIKKAFTSCVWQKYSKISYFQNCLNDLQNSIHAWSWFCSKKICKSAFCAYRFNNLVFKGTQLSRQRLALGNHRFPVRIRLLFAEASSLQQSPGCLSICETGESGREEIKKQPHPSPNVLGQVNVRKRKPRQKKKSNNKKYFGFLYSVFSPCSILSSMSYFQSFCNIRLIHSRFHAYFSIWASKKIIQTSFAFPPQYRDFMEHLLRL